MLPAFGIRASAMADTASGACLMNAATGEIVFERSANEKLPMASTTKIMTLIVALEMTDPNELVTVPGEAVREEGSSAYLEENAVIPMRDVCYGLMLNSGNDAAVAIAYHVSGGIEEFARLMNETAARIGAKDSCFKNPSGLDDDGHYTTAHDLALITSYALNNSEFCEITATKQYMSHYTRADGTEGATEYINHNKLLRSVDGCIGVKTGYTKSDGRCLVSAARRDGVTYIAVTLNSPNDWQEHKEMLEYGFSSCRMIRAVNENETVKHISANGGECAFVAETGFDIPVNSKRGSDFYMKISMMSELDVPINSGEKVGLLEIYGDAGKIGEVNIIADRDFNAKKGIAAVRNCFWFYAMNVIRNAFG